MTSEKYREYLTASIKVAGEMISDMAEDIAGTTDNISNLSISIDFDQDFLSIPEVTITRSHFPSQEKIDILGRIR